MISDEHEYEKPEEIVEKFNEYFSTIGQTINQQIENCTESYSINETEFSMFLKSTNIPEVKKVIDNLNAHKSAGIDGIPADVIKNCSDIFAPLLTSLINLSFSQGTFPSCLKIARVIPISKGSDKTDMNNYRPISLLSVVSKVFERIMYSRIISFLEKFHLLNDSQFGFRSKRSFVDAIAHIVEKVREDHHKTFYTCIFLDLKKAFDTVDHTRLLQKIYNIGIRGKAFYWLQSYLQGRTQVVSINNCSSQVRDINYGVPQGSILGPLLFIIYINDIISVCDKIQPTLFADDTNLLISMEKTAITEFANDMELNRIDMWLKVNKLSLNLDKTHCMPFKKKIDVMISLWDLKRSK